MLLRKLASLGQLFKISQCYVLICAYFTRADGWMDGVEFNAPLDAI